MQNQDIGELLSEIFGFSSDPSEPDSNTGFSRLDLSGSEFEIPAILFGLLRHLGCRREAVWEKTAWVFTFGVSGVTCLVSSEKFGIHLYVPESSPEGFAGKVRGMLIVGLQRYSNYLKALMHGELSDTPDFGFINQTGFLRRGYMLFRSNAETAYLHKLQDGKRTKEIGSSYTSINFDQEPWWNSFAASVTFFSYLEHLYSGLLAFTGHSHSVIEVKNFMSLSWRKKHERLFKEVGIFDANQFHRLDLIFQNQRNLFSHGLGGKPGSTIYQLIPNVGFVPSLVTSHPIQPNFLFSKDHKETFESNCKEFDEIESYLMNSALGYGMTWAKSGLNFRFDSNFTQELALAIKNNSFEDFIAEQSYLTDREANFE